MMKILKRFFSHQSLVRLLWHRFKADCAAVLYGFPAKKLVVIGITGTDGKTTTVGMIAHILNECGIQAGALSTAFFQSKDQITMNPTQKTSPSPFAIQKFLAELVKHGCTHAVIECSSHGLMQGRVHHIYPAVAGITNVSPEHLDYHGTMDEYIRAKSLLFRMLRKNGTKVLNADDASFAVLKNIPAAQTVAYAPVHQLKEMQGTSNSCTANLHIDGSDHTLELRIPGIFNLNNALCAICCATYDSKLTAEKAIHALSTFKGVPGRMERIDVGQNFSVYVDFTVTPAAYQATLSALRSALPEGKRLLVLTGSCGDRMREKRPLVGKICSELADLVVVTNEDPYTEDPKKIIEEVWAGIDQSKTEAYKIFDRREAIKFIFSKAQRGDAVILCAKGSDTTMWTAEGQIPWNEREMAKNLLKEESGRRKEENGITS